MTHEHEPMTDREIAREALDSNRRLLDSLNRTIAVADGALAVNDECRENERKMVGAAEWLNGKFKRLSAIHFDLFRAVLEFRDELREVGEDHLADNLDKICSASMISLENSVLQKREAMN